MPIRLIPSDWLNWIANFFNDTTWTGLTFTPTQDGLGCEIEVTASTIGVTKTFEVAIDFSAGTSYELEFIDGLLKTVTEV